MISVVVFALILLIGCQESLSKEEAEALALKEVGKKVIEAASKYPPDRTLLKPVLQAGLRATKDGIKSYVISEVKEGKYKEAIARINKIMLFYAELFRFI